MLNAIANLGALSVVKTVEGSDEIAGNAAYAFKRRVGRFFASALRTNVAVNNAIETARGIRVNRMIDSAVSNAGFTHRVDNLFESFEVLRRVAVELYVGNMSGVG